MSYGRDSLAGLLRVLERVLADIKDGKFRPDQTRSGRWLLDAKSASSSDAPVPLPLEPAETLTASDSDSSDEDVQSEGSSGEDTQLLQSVSHSLALLAGHDDFQFLSNVRSGIVHISRRDADRLLCGRTIFSGLRVTSTVDFSRELDSDEEVMDEGTVVSKVGVPRRYFWIVAMFLLFTTTALVWLLHVNLNSEIELPEQFRKHADMEEDLDFMGPIAAEDGPPTQFLSRRHFW
eukprot:s287_g7.t1